MFSGINEDDKGRPSSRTSSVADRKNSGKNRSLSSCGSRKNSRSAFGRVKRSVSEDHLDELCNGSGEGSIASRLNASKLMALLGKSTLLNLDKFTKGEITFFERVIPLIAGCNMYKKFSQKQMLGEKTFDPLHAEKHLPDQCGYGIRSFCLD